MRDLIMAALGAASGLGVVVGIIRLMKMREDAARHREFTGGEPGDFTATMRQSRDDYAAHGEFD